LLALPTACQISSNNRTTEALQRYPYSGTHGGKPGLCKRAAACDGRCGCEACAQSFMDNGLDEKVGAICDRGAKQ